MGDSRQEKTASAGYSETIAMVFADFSNVTEWHDSPISQEAVNEVALSEGETAGNYGKMILLINEGSQAAKITIGTVYPFDESP